MAGFNLDLSQGSSDYVGKLETYYVDASHSTLLAPGDVMRITGESNDEGIAQADAATSGLDITGVINSVAPIFEGEQLSETGLPSGTGGYIECLIDPNLNFIAEVTGGALSSDQVGLNIDVDFAPASKTGGLTISNMKLDSGSASISDTLPFRIVGLEKNSSGVVDGLKARVRFNATTNNQGSQGV